MSEPPQDPRDGDGEDDEAEAPGASAEGAPTDAGRNHDGADKQRAEAESPDDGDDDGDDDEGDDPDEHDDDQSAETSVVTPSDDEIPRARPVSTAKVHRGRGRPAWLLPSAAVAGAIVIVAAGLGLYVRSIVGDEAAQWEAAERRDTRESWDGYVAWGRELRSGGGLAAYAALEWTTLADRMDAARLRAIGAWARAALVDEDYGTMCRIVRRHGDTEGGVAAAEALGARATRGQGRVAAAGSGRGLPADAANALGAALESMAAAPCGDGAVVRLTYEVDRSAELGSPIDGTPPAETIEALPLPDQRAMLEGVARDFRQLAQGALPVRVLDADADVPPSVLDVHLSVTFIARDTYVTPGRLNLPGLAMRVRASLLGSGATGAHESTITYHLPETYGLELFRPSPGETEPPTVAEAYARMVEVLAPHVEERTRQVLALERFVSGSTHVTVGCGAPLPLSTNETVRGSTTQGSDIYIGSCSEPDDDDLYSDDYDDTDYSRRERIYRLVVPTRSEVAAVAMAEDFLATLYIRGDCRQANSELACDAELGQLVTTLDPGVYFLFVDSEDPGQSGRYQLHVAMREPGASTEACAAATPITVNTPASGRTTLRGTDATQGSCGGVGTAEQLHTLNLAEDARVRCVSTGGWTHVLYARESCDDASTEEACTLSVGGAARLRATLPAGEHTFVVDGSQLGQHGPYTLTCETAPPAGDGAPGDTCEAAIPIAADATSIAVDTFRARDDARATCASEGGADVHYRFELERPSLVQVRAPRVGGFFGTVSLGAGCDARRETACAAMTGTRSLEAELGAGAYTLTVDGAAGRPFSAGELQIERTDLQDVCDAAPLLRGGVTTASTPTTAPAAFRPACATQAARPGESAHRIVLNQRSRLQIDAALPFNGVMFLRDGCVGEDLECLRPVGRARELSIDRVLDAGTYYLFVSGQLSTERGAYTLRTRITPAG